MAAILSRPQCVNGMNIGARMAWFLSGMKPLILPMMAQFNDRCIQKLESVCLYNNSFINS